MGIKSLIFLLGIGITSFAFGQTEGYKNPNPKVSFVFINDQTNGVIEDVVIEMNIHWNDLSKSEVKGEANVQSLSTGNKMRDKHLKSEDYFNVLEHPRMLFTCSSIEKSGEKYIAKGILTIKDISNPIEFKLELRNDVLIWLTTIDTADFGISVKKGKDKNKVDIRVEVPITN